MQGGQRVILEPTVDQPEDESTKALRIAMRALEAASASVLLEDAHTHLALAVRQIAFVLGRVVSERSKSTQTTANS